MARTGEAEQLGGIGGEIPLAVDVENREGPALLGAEAGVEMLRKGGVRGIEFAHLHRAIRR